MLSDQGSAPSGVVGLSADLDPKLALKMEAWPTLSSASRASILAMVEALGVFLTCRSRLQIPNYQVP